MRTALAATAILLAGAAAFLAETEGLAAFTSETARRLEVERSPRALPPIVLRDPDGAPIDLPTSGRAMLLEFVYTRCPTLCVTLGGSFARIQGELARAGAPPVPQLLSVSFDPEHDGPDELRAYGEGHGADPAHWRVVVPEDATELRALLDALGVVVIPDGEGGFVHNAALHLIDRRGRLAAILDPEEVERAVAGLLR